ncbi:MAG: shikimate dehydrogenase [bacterium]
MIDPPSRLVLLGHPVAHSISPRFQNAALAAAGMSIRYETMDVPPNALATTMAMLATEHAAGNATIPHKEALAALCNRLSPLAQRVGAANVFWHEDGALVGDNSDVGGAEMVIRAFLGTTDSADIVLLGAGGSAASVICAAERCGVREVRIVNRNAERAVQLAARFPTIARPVHVLETALSGASLVVNATPIGLHDDSMPMLVELLPRDCSVFDLVYRTNETAWVRAARDAGHHAADGDGMLLEQGAIAFERWFGIAPDRGAMWKAIH